MRLRSKILLSVTLFILSLLFGYWFITHEDKPMPRQGYLSTQHGQVAQFGMGCFLSGSQAFYDSSRENLIPGILSLKTGYAGGKSSQPTDKEIGDHIRVVQLKYNPAIITYNQLLDLFWHHIDIFNDKGQFCDEGPSYRAVIFYTNAEQQALAESSKKRVEFMLSKKNPVLILPAGSFYEASARYQGYCERYPLVCRYHDFRCKRTETIKRIWGDVACFHP